jgi:hypothetical protein
MWGDVSPAVGGTLNGMLVALYGALSPSRSVQWARLRDVRENQEAP